MYNNQRCCRGNRVQRAVVVLLLCILLVGYNNNNKNNNSPWQYTFHTNAIQYDRNGRYSYSLTTFDPSGKLGQVERAIEAAEQGTPIVALMYTNKAVTTATSTTSNYGIILMAPQILPNVFTIDDGTTRFSLITPNIMISHSGLSSDGRILVSAAQKLAIQHEYTFDEIIDVHILLEELSLLYQEYTMKVAARPFGATLIIAYVPSPSLMSDDMSHPNSNQQQPALYRIDPSGTVEVLEPFSIVNGKNLLDTKTDLVSNLKLLSNDLWKHNVTIEEYRNIAVESLRTAIRQNNKNQGHDNKHDNVYRDDLTILSATLSRDGNDSSFHKESHIA